MELVIVTGLSGAGKSAAVDALEDIGFFCVDNMPTELIPTFMQLILRSEEHRERVAIVADIRLGSSFAALFSALDGLDTMNVPYKILFIDADNDTIMRRYQETRRKHPLADELHAQSIAEAINRERELLSASNTARRRMPIWFSTFGVCPIPFMFRNSSSTQGWKNPSAAL